MARVPQVTRTIKTTKAKIMCLDITTGDSVNKEITLTRTFKDDAHVLKAAKPIVETDNLKAVHVIETREEETLYGMTEQKFIELADVLHPRSTENKTEETNN